MSFLHPTRDRAFIRHYIEMVVAMYAGMIVLGLPLSAGLDAVGVDSSEISDTVSLLNMAVIMTVPMVGWMRYRGHSWRPCWEMAASMFVPTFVAIALMTAGVTSYASVMMLEHVAMFPSMLFVMLLRPAEYTSCHTEHGAARPAATA